MAAMRYETFIVYFWMSMRLIVLKSKSLRQLSASSVWGGTWPTTGCEK